MIAVGYQQVYPLKGGLNAWQEAGQSMEDK